jgi:hypothetical protein
MQGKVLGIETKKMYGFSEDHTLSRGKENGMLYIVLLEIMPVGTAEIIYRRDSLDYEESGAKKSLF